jgi:hypothetical protein
MGQRIVSGTGIRRMKKGTLSLIVEKVPICWFLMNAVYSETISKGTSTITSR